MPHMNPTESSPCRQRTEGRLTGLPLLTRMPRRFFNPEVRQLRQFLVALGLVAGAASVWLLRRGGLAAGAVLGVLAVSALVFAWLNPRVAKWPFAVACMISWPVGCVLGFLASALVYHGVVTPIGLFLRLRKRDRLRLAPPAENDSLWTKRTAEPDPNSYLRQF